MLSSLEMDAYLEKLCSIYRKRRDGLLAALDSHLKDFGLSYNRPSGGFFIWGKIDGIADMMDFTRYAVVQEKIGVIPGSVFFVAGTEDFSSVRFSFAKVDDIKAEEGTKRLARAIKSYRGM
jgi:DNA-binding transcriptional MocR family regulator